MTNEKNIKLWSFLEKLNINVYCICLKERDDRYQSACKQLSKVGLLPYTIFYRPLKNREGGRKGCWLSHRWCIHDAYKNKKQAALIFEDDIVFTQDWEKQLSIIEHFLKHESDWNLFRLGCYILKCWEPCQSTDNIWRITCVQTHAYFVNNSYMKAFLNSKAPTLVNHIDSFFIHSTTKDYSLLEPIVYQDATLGSDNLWNFKFKGIDLDLGILTQKFVQQFIDFEQLQKINNCIASYLRFIPKEYRPNTLPNIVHHNIQEPVLLL